MQYESLRSHALRPGLVQSVDANSQVREDRSAVRTGHDVAPPNRDGMVLLRKTIAGEKGHRCNGY